MVKRNVLFSFALSCLLIGGCSHALEDRSLYVDKIVAQGKWQKHSIDGEDFRLTALWPRQQAITETFYIYIEGDGLSWLNRSTPSSDPTPINPVALELALQHGENSAYLARPCQYDSIKDVACSDNKWWTSHRFAPEVIKATNQAIDTIKAAHKAQNLVLLGYSGGGTVAALVATLRSDVSELITVAGNLDMHAWTNLHKVQGLSGSMNPADQWMSLQDIPQYHYAGKLDEIVPLKVIRSYAQRFPDNKRPKVVVMDNYDHTCCWKEVWVSILSQNKVLRSD